MNTEGIMKEFVQFSEQSFKKMQTLENVVALLT